MYDLLRGIRVIDMAMYAFGPMTSAVLADWGADVVKVMDPRYPDLLQTNATTSAMPPARVDVAFLWETVNRGKRAIGIDTGAPEGRAVLVDLVKSADVFVTSFLPQARKKQGIDVEDIRAMNPRIIYARASGYGPRGDEAAKPGFDHTAFWARSGIAHANMQLADEFLPQMSPAFGDVLSGMSLAGGVAAALLKRERTGEAPVVDVSLFGTALFAFSPNVVASPIYGVEVIPREHHAQQRMALVTGYKTRDNRYVYLCGAQNDAAYRNFFEVIGRRELLEDARFRDNQASLAHGPALITMLDHVFAAHTLAEWLPRLEALLMPWCVVQSAADIHRDQQARANGYLAPVESAKGEAFTLVASPAQFDGQAAELKRAPLLGEHTDAVLRELGRNEAEIARLRAAKAVV
jgi:crotonobetainyl-CoA:carnitine CoA-transferase CaiB-like acyl-CoA transferase